MDRETKTTELLKQFSESDKPVMQAAYKQVVMAGIAAGVTSDTEDQAAFNQIMDWALLGCFTENQL